MLTKVKRNNENNSNLIDRSLLDIKHDNLVKFYDSYLDMEKEKTVLYIVTRKYEWNLYSILNDRISFHLGRNEIILYFIQLVEAVEYLHSKNLFHSCIHLKNIFVHRNVLKLSGFHFCEKLESKEQTFDVAERTLCYNCPETRIGLKYDVWCIGAILYEIFYEILQRQSLSSSLIPVEMFFGDFDNWDNKLNKTTETIKQTNEFRPFKDNFETFIQLEPSNRIDLTNFVQNLKKTFKESYLLPYYTHERIEENLKRFKSEFNNLNERYCIEDCLGSGGFGSVFRINDRLDFKAPIKALKRIQTGKVEEFDTLKLYLKIIAREKNILNELSTDEKMQQHPNVIRFYEQIIFNEYTCLITEYCQNGDLKELIRYKRRNYQQIEIKDQLDYAVQLLYGLKYIHSLNIVHRDIKPSNLLLTNNYKTIKYSDFGLSIQFDSLSSLCNSVVGTLSYSAPEVCNSKQYDNKIDIWSLGCVFYEIGSLKQAFKNENLINCRIKITSLEENSPNLSEDHPFFGLIQKMLQKDPTKRSNAESLYKEAKLLKHNF